MAREAARRLSAPAGDDGWKAVVAKWRSDYGAAELRAINALEALQLAKTCLLVTPGVPQIVIDRVNEALLSAPAPAAPRVGDEVRARIIEMIRHDYEPPELIADAIIDLFAAFSPPAASADEREELATVFAQELRGPWCPIGHDERHALAMRLAEIALGYRKRAAQVDREALMGVICLAMKEYVMEGPAGLARRIEQFILARS